jgi:hypothetical protein
MMMKPLLVIVTLTALVISCGDSSPPASSGVDGAAESGGMLADGSLDASGDATGYRDARPDVEAGIDAGGVDSSLGDGSSSGDGSGGRDGSLGGDGSGDAPGGQFYTTSFPLTENPISEGGHWINGGTTGLDWGNVETTPGLAFGTVVSGGPPYNDSTAVRSGGWGTDQTAQATVHIASPNSAIFEEVELRLRTTITPHSITGYEFNFRCTSDGSQYAQIVRWNGPLNSFTYLNAATGPGLHDGDVVKATAVGSTLTSYINGVQQVQWTDSTYPGGSPGVGFYNQGGTAMDNASYGFTSFTATSP